MIRRLLLLCSLLMACSASAQNWPRNPKTRQIEFRGLLPWPASVTTEAQRKTKAREWYLKVTNYTAEELRRRRALNIPDAKFCTYSRLPNSVLWVFGEESTGLFVLYNVHLQPTSQGLLCVISHLRWNSGRGVSPGYAGGELPEVPLEQVVKPNISLPVAILTYRDKQNGPYFHSDYGMEDLSEPLRAEELTPEVDSAYQRVLAGITNSTGPDVLEKLRRRLAAAVRSW